MIPRKFLSGASLVGAGLAIGLMLSACGLGRNSQGDGEGIRDPVVAATVNGRPIYREDVRAYAVAFGLLEETEDLDGNSQAYESALDRLIEQRLFSMEAEAKGLDREPDIRRRIENMRDWVLAQAIYEEIDQRATDPETAERLYRQNQHQLGQGTEVHLRHIQFNSREAADAAKRRLDGGERFEALAFELSTNRETAPDGGDLGFAAVGDISAPIREAVERGNVGDLLGPIQVEDRWHLVRVEDRRERGGPSLEELRPRIVEWLRFEEISTLRERLERDARIERLSAPEVALDPGEEVQAPADAEPREPVRPAPDVAAPPGQTPPPFPFPIGPGGVTGAAQAPAQEPAAPAPQTSAPATPTPQEQGPFP
jgi:peptidyl-prolyl cis-trans isomerase C